MTNQRHTLVCKWFDKGTCINDDEFPEGTPTEMGESYCRTCKSYDPIDQDEINRQATVEGMGC